VDPKQAWNGFDWRAKGGLAEMCADHWRWQSRNPDGYQPQAAVPASEDAGCTSALWCRPLAASGSADLRKTPRLAG